MCTSIIRGAVLAVLFATIAAFALAQQIFSLKGQVTGPHGDIRQFVSVSLEGPGRYSAMTDANGTFTVRNVIPGKYTIRVRKGNLVSVFEAKDVSEDKLDIKIPW